MNNEDTDIASVITTFNTAVTETASEMLAKHRQKKKNWITAEILDLCDKRRELRKRRFEREGSEKYKEVNNNIKRCMEKAKETGNWRHNLDFKKNKTAQAGMNCRTFSKILAREDKATTISTTTKGGGRRSMQPCYKII